VSTLSSNNHIRGCTVSDTDSVVK